ncbi:hypothetical protein O3P69_010351 [Scylla paramamosain]|uniref:Uncharacterized protein n=1 Tax=Scylla paramamosain TaxID=85552 RepID=A0AAW0TTG9_SCYPA
MTGANTSATTKLLAPGRSRAQSVAAATNPRNASGTREKITSRLMSGAQIVNANRDAIKTQITTLIEATFRASTTTTHLDTQETEDEEDPEAEEVDIDTTNEDHEDETNSADKSGDETLSNESGVTGKSEQLTGRKGRRNDEGRRHVVAQASPSYAGQHASPKAPVTRSKTGQENIISKQLLERNNTQHGRKGQP